MIYRPNPKTAGSGIVCCIPQKGPKCPVACEDCFFQSGRSYLEPLDKNLPNMPGKEARGRIVWVNDGLDSNVDRDRVISATALYGRKFFNTAIPKDLDGFPAPVVLTANPGNMTDTLWHRVDPIPSNLMFVRVRVNTWNLETVVDPLVEYYAGEGIPVVLTFMAYYDVTIPERCQDAYEFRRRTLNSYWVLKPRVWQDIADRYKDNLLVSTCGVSPTEHACVHCGVCLREFYATMERIGRHGENCDT